MDRSQTKALGTVPVLCGGLLLALPLPGAAQTADDLTWTARKCALYQDAVGDALQILGRDGLRDIFIARNDAFIAGGCLTQGDVCPETPQELAFADLLTVMTMNEGMASTFVPFGCPD